MKLKWLGTMIGWAVMVAAAGGCDGGSSTSTGGDGGTGAGGDTGGGGSTSTSTGGTTSTTSSTTSAVDPCAGVIEGFVPEWKPSEGLHQALCDEAQVNAFFAACLEMGATQETCNAFTMENGACAGCIVSAPADEKYGPITLYDEIQLIYENPGQCVSEIEGDPSDKSCGAKIFSTIQCSVAACSECKDVAFNTLLQCLTDAEKGSCKSFAGERDACIAELQADGVPIEPCLYPGGDFYAYIKSLSILACGP